MKAIHTLNIIKLAACMVVAVVLSASASASCGDSLASMAMGATAVVGQFRPIQQGAQTAGSTSDNSSMVGLWHIQFEIGGQAIQEAYQVWNAGGTEVHNPNVDPRTGNVCLGAWTQLGSSQTYKLTHRVWNYDDAGNFMGTIRLHEKVTLGPLGNAHHGSFSLEFYDPSGNFVKKVAGNVVGERVSVE